ncbi:hypothetical protein M9H77_03130 [Catharanthus roseus]|uniref:Uncharacterized protein n=1 Tax=Catharanthus roseus TaxID=4058 RepID=A0ACC0CAI6_CATRO|nr:hypothetical protein M9H77_03130 [Catharanthus roseus]
MFLLMDTMICRFKILNYLITVDIKEDHKLEVEEEEVSEEEDTTEHKRNFKDMKHGMKITCLNSNIANQLELYPYTTYEDIVVPKPQESTHKSWPKKEDTPKVAFKDHSKPKVEEKGKLITNLTRCFKCNRLGHIATKRTFVFREDLNGWLEKSDDDCQEDIYTFKSNISHSYLRYLPEEDTTKKG